LIYRNQTTLAQDTIAEPVQTTTVRRGDLVVSATGAGTVIPASEVELGFDSGGVLTEIPVTVGSQVSAGDVLARVNDADARMQVADAELNLAQAQLQLAKLKQEPTTAELASAEGSLASAQATLESRVQPSTGQDIAAAQQSLLSAQQKLADLLAGPSAEESTAAEVDLKLAEITLQQAQSEYDKVAWRPEVAGTSQAAALQEATLAYQKAKAAYDTAMKGATAAEISAARASVAQAQSTLDSLRQGSTGQEIAAARAAVEQAQAQLDELKAGTAAIDLELSEISVQQAQNALTAAQTTLAETVLHAPFAGTVTAIAASVGERVGSSTLVTLADLNQPLVEVYLDETDLDKVGLDYAAEVTFDALPDQAISGKVVQVDPELVNSNGVSTVRAIVQLDAGSFAKPQTLPIGLNASVEVIGGRATQALLVPVEALREITPGQYAVFVMENGQPTLRLVEVGLMDYTYAEITAGLEQGDVVTTGIVETQ
jgi:multidrug efflux pump subunit AcrA (membrane-fusion protein)